MCGRGGQVIGVSGDLREVAALRGRRRAAAEGRSAGMPWGDADEEALSKAVDAARNGVGFFFVT